MKVAITNNHLPVFVVRKWMDIQKEREFRCFVREGKLIGITQYYHHDRYDWIISNQDEIRKRIEGFYIEIKGELDSLSPTIVFDVHVGEEEVLLIETNPYGLSDPCLFTYEGLDQLSEVTLIVKEELKENSNKLSE